MRLIYAFLLISISTIVPFGVNAQTRHALVIGIDDYDYVEPLQKARNDARAVHGALEAAGFEADLLLDGTGISVVQALEAFTDRLSPGDEAVFFFAGHGVELEGENILLPADIPAPERGGDLLVRRFGIPVQDVLDQIQRRGARLSLLILDACRDTPFPRQGTRSLGGTRGLARMSAPEGTFIMYSAGAGQAALDRLSNDDPDPNSVFTRALLPRITTPGLELSDLVREVRSEVRQLARTVGHNQFPAFYDQLDGEFQFIPAAVPPGAEAGLVAAPCASAAKVWPAIQDSDSQTALEQFVQMYRASCPALAALAEERLSRDAAPEMLFQCQTAQRKEIQVYRRSNLLYYRFVDQNSGDIELELSSPIAEVQTEAHARGASITFQSHLDSSYSYTVTAVYPGVEIDGWAGVVVDRFGSRVAAAQCNMLIDIHGLIDFVIGKKGQ